MSMTTDRVRVRPWTDDEERLLGELRKTNTPVPEMADKLNRTIGAINNRIFNHPEIGRKQRAKVVACSVRTSWSDEDVQTLNRMDAEGRTDTEIAVALDRTERSVRNKRYSLEFNSAASNGKTMSTARPPMRVMVDRELRERAAERLDLTGQIFGDPPPGFSALDRRMGR